MDRTSVSNEVLVRFMLGISLREHIRRAIIREGGKDDMVGRYGRRIMKRQVHKFHIQLFDPYDGRVVAR